MQPLVFPAAAVLAVRAVADGGADGHGLSWIDMDQAVSQYCKLAALAVPEGREEKMSIHIKAVREWTA
jgi:hypothetical protein